LTLAARAFLESVGSGSVPSHTDLCQVSAVYLPPSVAGGETAIAGAWQERGSSTLVVSYVEHLLIDRVYDFRGSRDVIFALLAGSPHVISLLIAIPSVIHMYFDDPRLTLEVVADPEGGGDDELVLYIGTNLPPSQALDKLDQLNDACWVQYAWHEGRGLVVDVESM